MEIEVKEPTFEKVHINEGLYNAKLKDIKDIEEGKYGERVALVFEVYHSTEEKPVELAMVAYKQLTPNAKFSKALTPLGAEIKVGSKINTNDFIGKYCRVLVETYQTSDGKDASGIGKVMSPDEKTEAFIEKVSELIAKGKTDKKPTTADDIEIESVE